VDFVFAMKDAPPIGSVIERDGLQYERIWSRFNTHVEPDRFPHTSYALPRNMPGEKCDKKGCVIVQSKQHETNLASKYSLTRIEPHA
jgi:hypothetical protein